MNLDKLFDFISTKDLLTTARAGGQMPIYIYAYPETQEVEFEELLKGLCNRLMNAGKTVEHKDLFEMTVEILKEDGMFDRLLEVEPENSKDEIASHIGEVAGFVESMLPRIEREVNEKSATVVLLSGVGKCYPFLRSKAIIHGLETGLKDTPVILFFPGTYDGWSLMLFGNLPEHSYRAINLSGQLN